MKYKNIMLIISFLSLVIASVTLFKNNNSIEDDKKLIIMQQSTGDGSPNINGVNGNVEIK